MASDMRFIEFAEALQPYLAEGRTTGEYVRSLFLSICDPPDDGFILSGDEAAFRSYVGSTRRGIAKPAQEALGYLDRDKFVYRLQKLPADSIDSLAKDFVALEPKARAASICDDCADVFIGILKNGAVRHRARGKADTCEDGGKLMELAIDEGNACPVCGMKLVVMRRGKIAYRCRVVPTLPPDARTDYRLERSYKNALPDGCSEFANVAEIALCCDCADKYEEGDSTEAYLALARSWEACRARATVNEMAAGAPLDDRIAEVIREITVADADAIAELRMEPVALKRKIASGNALLSSKVRAYVTEYYKFVESCFSDLDAEERLSFELIASQVRTFYLSRGDKDAGQSLTFEAVSDWIGRRAHSADRPACEALASFFVQNCEVFDEIAE